MVFGYQHYSIRRCEMTQGCVISLLDSFSVLPDVIHITPKTKLVRSAAGLKQERWTPGSTTIKDPRCTDGCATAARHSPCCVAHTNMDCRSWLTASPEVSRTTLSSYRTRRLWLGLWSPGPFMPPQQKPVTALKKGRGYHRKEQIHPREEHREKTTRRRR